MSIVLGSIGVAIVDDAVDDLDNDTALVERADHTDSAASADGTGVTSPGAPAAHPTTAAAPAAPTGPPVAAVGQTLTVQRDGSDLGELTVSAAETTRAAPDGFSDRPANGYHLTVTVSTKTTGSDSFDVNPSDFYVRTANGQHLDTSAGNAVLASRDDALDHLTLAPGKTTKGTVTFDVPAAHRQLVYAPNYDGLPVGSWSL